ncbi:MAG TPA: hypothetical protein VFH97_03905 [Gemmatimonadales bacterium]|nr:hypothetical protein [Gemmatimonadales bacterium]
MDYVPALLSPNRPLEGAQLDLPTSHRVPVSWLRAYASAPIKWRTVNDILPPGAASAADYEHLRNELLQSKQIGQVLKKQKVSGLWGDNILGLAPSKTLGYKDVGTVAQYRHLLELGLPRDSRAFRLSERLFYRLLSRDESPDLAFEYKAASKGNPELAAWARALYREGATVALAQAGLVEDPRVRGSAHRIATGVSQFLRSELSAKPLVRRGSRTVLHPEAFLPTVMSVAMISYMPTLQRERAGFIERLCSFLAEPQPKKKFVIPLGRKAVVPVFHLMGNPVEVDRSGNPKDLPLALMWIEILVRMGMLQTNEPAVRALQRLLADVDHQGVWAPRNLRTLPKSPSRLADFAFPLEADTKTLEGRQVDVTFRLALIAKLAGWTLEYT